MLCKNSVLKKLIAIQRKTPVLGSHFYEVAACNFIKMRFQHSRFPANFAQFPETPISKNTCKWLLPKQCSRMHANYAWFALTNSLSKQDGCDGKIRCALVERSCVFFPNFCFKRKESNPIWIIRWNPLTIACDVGRVPSISLFMICKERQNLCINRTLLNLELLDRVLRKRTTSHKINNYKTFFGLFLFLAGVSVSPW